MFGYSADSLNKTSIVASLVTIFISILITISPSRNTQWNSDLDNLYTLMSALISVLFSLTGGIAILGFIGSIGKRLFYGKWNKLFLINLVILFFSIILVSIILQNFFSLGPTFK